MKFKTLSKSIYESSTPIALYRAWDILPRARLGVDYLVKLRKEKEEFLCLVSSRRARELFPALLENKS
jgi:hypothetical protein